MFLFGTERMTFYVLLALTLEFSIQLGQEALAAREKKAQEEDLAGREKEEQEARVTVKDSSM